MSEPPRPPDDRWQQLIRAFDPERNMRAVADMLEQAAAGSEQVLDSVRPSSNGADPEAADGEQPSGLRGAFAEIERSFARFYDTAGKLMVERPLGSAISGTTASGSRAEIAVLDGVGTTVVQIPGAEGTPRCGELRRHDNECISRDAITILRSTSFEGDDPTFVIRVDAPASTNAGAYHGQILVEGLPDLALSLMVTVVDSAE